jgi:hypothetical protein
MSETNVENQIENLRRRCESALQRRLDNPNCLSPGTLIRILSPVIEKYLAAGLMLEEIASALQEEGLFNNQRPSRQASGDNPGRSWTSANQAREKKGGNPC